MKLMPRRIARAFADLASARTWKATAYFLFAPISGGVWFAITVAGISGAIVIPLIALALGAMRYGAELERPFLRTMLGTQIDDPYRPLPPKGFWARLWARLADPATWKDAVYLNLLFPLGLAWGIATATLWGVAVGLVTMPIWYRWPEPPDATVFLRIDTLWKALLAALVGLAVALLIPPLLRAFAAAHSWVARGLLGSSQKERLRRRATQLQSTRARTVDAAAAERRRIERDLHDGAQQRLVALAMDLGMAKEKLASDPDTARALVSEAHEEAKRAIVELRDLARGIHPAVLTDRGLDAALSSLAGRSPVPVRVDVRLDERPPASVESITYFVVAEALTNVAKHAGASRAEVVVERVGDRVVAEVRDDGAGGAQAAGGGGLAGLTERLAGVDGSLTVTSPEGGPTIVRAELPCAS